LLQVAREFGEAWAKGDLATLERFLADEYVHTDIAGHFMRRAAWLEQASRQIEQLTISFRDLDAAIYGDVGVVTEQMTSVVARCQLEPFGSHRSGYGETKSGSASPSKRHEPLIASHESAP
jgi:hypothetical protein